MEKGGKGFAYKALLIQGLIIWRKKSNGNIQLVVIKQDEKYSCVANNSAQTQSIDPPISSDTIRDDDDKPIRIQDREKP
ncbi:hypothetical protein PoB_002502900 [Plakobranchus ocellatus]|uniref:Uncharacterized protein n=1 Tax=Plakobranchus ocellatus TaxID=259542 RepID=A0AAV3ZVQ2_9GAST|nr:hypothetical protein PoB_002502900 [Plakobranchus ocellatus]